VASDECRDFLRGSCSRGSDCRFRHAAPAQIGPTSYGVDTETKVFSGKRKAEDEETAAENKKHKADENEEREADEDSKKSARHGADEDNRQPSTRES